MASILRSTLWISNILLFSTLIVLDVTSCVLQHSWSGDDGIEIYHAQRRLASGTDLINSTQEADALIEFRDGVTEDPTNVFSLWSSSNTSFCSWTGVTCEGGHVSGLHLSKYSLAGSISKSLGLLQFLTVLDLSDNNFTGRIPPQLGSLRNLTTLNLSANNLLGFIPSELGMLQSLRLLLLSVNNLTGSIPTSLTNCSDLTQLVLSTNQLSGNMSLEWGDLRHLEILYLAENRLDGPIPDSIGNCSSLREIDLPGNLLSGVIPSSLGMLQNLRHFRAFENSLSGDIPLSLGNLSSLIDLYLYGNNLSGQIPEELGRLSNLEVLSLWRNNLEKSIPGALANCSALVDLELSDNVLTGEIPEEFGKLRVLEILYLMRNNLVGHIPQSLGNSSALQELYLNDNRLTGDIPPQLGLLINLTRLSLGFNNRISGPIPREIENLASILLIDFSFNNLSGVIPPEIGNLATVLSIDFSFNSLSSVIPSNLGSCRNLQSLDLSSNDLDGEIPVSLTSLKSLTHLNVSFNQLTGAIPENGSFWNLSRASFEGNPSLCGQQVNRDCSGCRGVLCNRPWIYAVSALAGVLASVAVLVCVCSFCNVKRERLAPVIELPPMNYFTDEFTLSVADLMVATDGFSDYNVIGVGGRSTVYKGTLSTGQLIAVKRLVLGSDERAVFELYRELQLLSNLQHPNLLRIYGLCTTTEITAMVLEYMANGSLHKQLHEGGTCYLTWEQRLDIAIGIADALVYLHHDFAKPILHLDLKPSNILLDSGLKVKVADYGISRYVNHERHGEATLSSSLYGTIGYIPPEYGESPNVSTKGDVYNFGVILMELLTRKQPTDDMFGGQEASSLRNWVLDAFPDSISDVLDETLRNSVGEHEEALRLMLRLGLSCTQESPRDRPTTIQVRDLLEDIRLLPLQKHQKLLPGEKLVRFRD